MVKEKTGFQIGLLLATAVGMVVGTASATPIVGGSEILDAGSALQLEGMLGQGGISLSNIFTKTVGSSSSDFHAACDGKGATFSVIELMDGTIVGGYNPQSWNSSGSYNMTPDDADRTAFLFDLTDARYFAQRLSSVPGYGEYQTYNGGGNGPTFGSGNDLSVDYNLNNCSVRVAGSWPDDGGGISYAPDNGFFVPGGSIAKLEVFSVAAIPEPATLGLIGLFGGGILAVRRIFMA